MIKRWVGALAGCAMIIAGASPAWSQPSQVLSFGPGRPVPPGNALAGKHTFDAICWACHSHDLTGGKAPPLIGSMFYKVWRGKRADALSDYIQNKMPMDDPGWLSQEMAHDLVAYIVAYSNKPQNLMDGQTGK